VRNNRGSRDEAGDEIVIDDRERASGLKAALTEIRGRPPKVQRLAVGDILVRRRILIERKRVDDFAASVIDGRLFRQLAELTAAPYETLVILEGDFADGGADRLSPGALRGAILSVSLDFNVPILRSRSIRDTARWVEAILRRGDAGAERPDWRRVGPTGRRLPKTAAPPRPRKRPVGDSARRRDQALRLLTQIDGVGETKARALLDRFGSIRAICDADRPALIQTPGIGRNMAEIIHAALHEDEAPR
jgi:Fanconi anemia group M protein